jgi:hypothetical protein
LAGRFLAEETGIAKRNGRCRETLFKRNGECSRLLFTVEATIGSERIKRDKERDSFPSPLPLSLFHDFPRTVRASSTIY